jgi:hypothetical protein
MLFKTLTHYKIPLLLSVTLAVVILGLSVVRTPVSIILVFLGSLLGTFILDLDYIIYAYFLEPNTDFSRTLTTYIKHRDFANAASFIEYHKHEVEDKTLHSILFQIVLAASVIFVVSASDNMFIVSLVLSSYVSTIYTLVREYLANGATDWFWSLKNPPTKSGVSVYVLVLLLILVYALSTL